MAPERAGHERFNAVEPGFNPGTGLGRDANVLLRGLARYVLVRDPEFQDRVVAETRTLLATIPA